MFGGMEIFFFSLCCANVIVSFNTLLINFPRLSPNVMSIAYFIMKISQDELFGYCMTFEICI